MFWYLLLGAVAIWLLITIALPVPRRIWAFSLITAKYFWLWLFDVIYLRKLWFAITGKSKKYQKLTRPVLLRMMCEDLGPTFIKFGQIIASSAGMFPDAYVKEFQKVLDRVRPFPFEDVRRTLDEDLGAEKAAHLVESDPKPLAAGSIRIASSGHGQVALETCTAVSGGIVSTVNACSFQPVWPL